MKKILFLAVFAATSLTSSAQVGINTKTPQGALDVVSAASGVIVPRVANINAVKAPVNGTLVYDIFNKCLRAYENGAWSNCLNGTVAVLPPVNVTSPTGKIWMDRNLGATRVATSSSDAASYGDLYQWGRLADGHQIRTSGTTATLSSTDVPGNANFITNGSANYNWRTTINDDLWQGVNGINNPCPAGYRLPTKTELNAERVTFSTTYAAGAFASVLKLPMAGGRNHVNVLFGDGTYAGYWTSTVINDSSGAVEYLHFSSTVANMATSYRSLAFSVRCIQD